MWRNLAMIKLWMIKQFEYRAELFVWASLSSLNMVLLFILWLSVFRHGQEIEGLGLNQVVSYFFIASVINTITATHFESWRAAEVRDGKIDHFLTKPLGYPLQILLADIGNKITYILLILPITLFIGIVYTHMLGISLPSLSLETFIQFVLLLCFAYYVEFAFAFLAVLATFWFESGEGLEHFKWFMISILSGYMIPLQFMPGWLKDLVELLPFKYMYSVPIQLFQGTVDVGPHDWIYVLSTSILTFIFMCIGWKLAVQKYTSAGG